MANEPYYWTRDTKRGRKEAFWSNGDLQLRVHGPTSHVNRVMGLILAVYPEPNMPGPPPKIVEQMPPLHPGQTDIISALAEQENPPDSDGNSEGEPDAD